MKTLHLVRSELRRLAPWILIAVSAVLLLDVIGWLLVLRSPVGRIEQIGPVWDRARYLSDVVRAVLVIVGLFFPVVLIQGDSAATGRSFWLTRPISGLRMAIAKGGVALIVLVLLPSLASLPWWLWCGFTWRHTALGFGEYAL